MITSWVWRDWRHSKTLAQATRKHSSIQDDNDDADDDDDDASLEACFRPTSGKRALLIWISAKSAHHRTDIHSVTLESISYFCTAFPCLNDGHVTWDWRSCTCFSMVTYCYKATKTFLLLQTTSSLFLYRHAFFASNPRIFPEASLYFFIFGLTRVAVSSSDRTESNARTLNPSGSYPL
jgi:hypothetical protein